MNFTYCVYLAMSRSPKQLLTSLKRADTNVVLIICDGDFCDNCDYTFTDSSRRSK